MYKTLYFSPLKLIKGYVVDIYVLKDIENKVEIEITHQDWFTYYVDFKKSGGYKLLYNEVFEIEDETFFTIFGIKRYLKKNLNRKGIDCEFCSQKRWDKLNILI